MLLPTKCPGGSVKNAAVVFLPGGCSDPRGRSRLPSRFRPPRAAPQVDKDPDALLSPLPLFSLSPSLCSSAPRANPSPSSAVLRRAIAAAPSFLEPIAATGRFASTSSTSPQSCGSWGGRVSSPSSNYRNPVVEPRRRNTSPLSPLRPLRPPQRLRGEHALLPDLLPLFRVVQVVVTVTVLFRRRSVSRHRRAPLSFPSSPVTNSQRRLRFMVRNQIPRRSHPLDRKSVV